MPSAAMQEAGAFFQAQKWKESADAYEAITKTEPANGRAWYRLGFSQQNLKQYEKAIAAYQKALEIMPATAKPLAMYNIGASYARLNEREKAFEWINNAFNAGFQPAVPPQTDPDLESLREDKARFQELLGAADRSAKPCMYQPENKQFGFIVGDWKVQDAKGQPVGTNRFDLIENGCIFVENWDDGRGGTGKSFNFYDTYLHKWRQTWVNNGGSVSEFSGIFKDGAIRYEGESHIPGTGRVLRRLTFFDQGPDRVRQFSEISTDDGKTWQVLYDFIYTRKK